MKIEINKKVRGDRLYEEIVSAMPSLAPTIGDDGFNTDVPLQLTFTDTQVTIEVPDGTDDAEIKSIVKAHNADTPDPVVLTPVEELNAGIQEATSLQDIKAVFSDWSEKYKDRI